VRLCALFGGETGQVLRHLIPDEGIELYNLTLACRTRSPRRCRRSCPSSCAPIAGEWWALGGTA